MQPDIIKEKSIKDLELMSKKLKKRISYLEKMPPAEDYSGQIAILVSEYRMLKSEIVKISYTQ